MLLAVAMRDPNISHFLNVSIFSPVRADALSQTSNEEETVSNGVYLPSERLRERQFDQAQRLIAGGRMADATALLDEMLTAEQDVFLESGSANDQTRRSMKALVTEIIGVRIAIFRQRSMRMMTMELLLLPAGGSIQRPATVLQF